MDQIEARGIVGGWGSFLRQHRRLAFDGVSLVSVRFHPGSWFDRCTFRETDLRQATFAGTHFKLCNFAAANLEGASLRGAWFSGCNFRDANLRYSDLTDAHFGRVNTGDPDSGRSDLTGADLRGSIRKRVHWDSVQGLGAAGMDG